MKQRARLAEIDLGQLGPPRDVGALSAFRRAILVGAGASVPEVEKVLTRFGIVTGAFADNSPAKQGTLFRGLPVLPPAELAEHMDGDTAIVIASAYQREIAEQLRAIGLPAQQIFPFVSPMFAGHFGREAFAGSGEALLRLPSRLADAESRATLAGLIAFRWTMDPLHLVRNPRLTGFYRYDAPGIGPLAGEHIVDVGAYNGDSAIAYLERLEGKARVSALEPLPQNLLALDQTIATHRFGRAIAAIPFGAGDVPATASLGSEDETPDARATLRGKEGATTTIRIETLDRLFARDRVDFIKIDVEGHDPFVLSGARDVLRRDRPGLAVAAYHAADHLWAIPALLDRLAPGYRIHLGHHPAAAYECEFFCVHPSRAGA